MVTNHLEMLEAAEREVEPALTVTYTALLLKIQRRNESIERKGIENKVKNTKSGIPISGRINTVKGYREVKMRGNKQPFRKRCFRRRAKSLVWIWKNAE